MSDIYQALTPIQMIRDYLGDPNAQAVGDPVVSNDGYGYHQQISFNDPIMGDSFNLLFVNVQGHKYLVAYGNCITRVPWYYDETTDLSSLIPYVGGTDGSVTRPDENKTLSQVCNDSDYYQLNQLTTNIWSAWWSLGGGEAIGSDPSKCAALAVRSIRSNLGWYGVWNLPNYEIMYYLWKYAYSYLPVPGAYWLPYSYSLTESWFFGFDSESITNLTYFDRTAKESNIVALPVAAIY